MSSQLNGEKNTNWNFCCHKEICEEKMFRISYDDNGILSTLNEEFLITKMFQSAIKDDVKCDIIHSICNKGTVHDPL